jgi:DNA repair exonuclease SbcCD ATPase subunit
MAQSVPIQALLARSWQQHPLQSHYRQARPTNEVWQGEQQYSALLKQAKITTRRTTEIEDKTVLIEDLLGSAQEEIGAMQALSEHSTNLQNQLQTVQASYDTTSSGLEQANTRIQELNSQLEDVLKQLDKRPTQCELDNARARVTELEGRPTEARLDELLKQLDKRPTQYELDNARARIRQLERRSTSMTELEDQTQDFTSTSKVHLRTKIITLEELLEDKSARVGDLESQITVKDGELTELEDDILQAERDARRAHSARISLLTFIYTRLGYQEEQRTTEKFRADMMDQVVKKTEQRLEQCGALWDWKESVNKAYAEETHSQAQAIENMKTWVEELLDDSETHSE